MVDHLHLHSHLQKVNLFPDGFHYIINAVFHVFCVYSSVSSSLWGLLLANRLEGKGSEVLGSRVRAHTRL